MKILSAITAKEDAITKEYLEASGANGDMKKAVYDTNNNGIVDKSESVVETKLGIEKKTWVGTKAEYAAITTKDPNTFYVTTDEAAQSMVALDETGHIPLTLMPLSIYNHAISTENPHQVTKVQVGLGNVDNTADMDKPVSTLVQLALKNLQGSVNNKAPLYSPTFTGTVYGIAKWMVGLGNVDDTADSAKPISIATQTALDLKASINDLSLKAPIESPTFTGTVGGITKAMVGLGNVDNTTDLNKPISTAVQAALDLKTSSVSPNFTGDILLNGNVTLGSRYTFSGLTKEMVGLNNVDNTGDTAKPISVATQNALNLKAPLDSPSFSGVIYFNGNVSFKDGILISGLKSSHVGLGNVTNESKTTMFTNPTFTGTVSGITKSMIGLDLIDNTTDLGKPISTATQAALDLKAPLANPTFTGTVNGITAAMVGLGNVTNESKDTMFNSPLITKLRLQNVTFSKAIAEQLVTFSTFPATFDLDIISGALFMSVVDATQNFTINFRGDATTTWVSATGGWLQSVTCTLIVSNGANAYYPTAFKIDNSLTPTIRWVGGAPTSGTANATDVYTFTLFRPVPPQPAFMVLASRTTYK